MAAFQMPELLVDADTPTWGPPADAIPAQFAALPFYRDFSKSAHVGRAADWTAAGEEQQEYRQKMRQQRIERERAEAGEDTEDAAPQERKRTGTGGIFGYTEGDETGFQLVDTSASHGGTKIKASGGMGMRGRGRGAPFRGGRGGWADNSRQGAFAQKAATGQRNDGQSRYGRRWRQRWRGGRGFGNMGGWGRQEDDEGVSRPWALEVQEEWGDAKHTFSIKGLDEVKAASIPEAEDIQGFGTLRCFDRSYDRCTTRNPVRLNTAQFEDTVFYNVTTSDDPVMQKLAADAPGAGIQVFTTAGIASHLMSTPRSAASWDVIVRRSGNKLFFDKRDNSEELNLLSVQENGVDPPLGPASTMLNTEATAVNEIFTQQVLRDGEDVEEGAEAPPSIVLGGPSPFVKEGEKGAAVGYKYRRYSFEAGGQEVTLNLRCEYEACYQRGKEIVPVTVRALNESFWEGSTGENDWKRQRDSTIVWRQRVDGQRSAVLAHELKLNANKVSKWMCEVMLADSKLIKLGYVSRVSAKNDETHEVLATQELQPQEFASHIQFDPKSAWGVMQEYIAECSKLEDGLYLLLRVPDGDEVNMFSVKTTEGLERQMTNEEEEEAYDF